MNISNQAKISVLIPVCNVAKYLPQCLESVIAQTMKELEIICINDGSTDNSLDIIKHYAEKDNRVLIIDKPNSGYGDSMNAGLKKASGEYIGIVESDDFIDKTMFDKLYSLSYNGTVDVIKSNFYNYYDDGISAPRADVDIDRIKIPTTKKPFTLKQNGLFSWGHPSVWSAIYRREFVVENNIHFIAAKGGGWVDNPFYYETLCAAKSVMWLNKPLYYYRKTNPTSSSNLQKDVTIPFVRMQDNFDVIERYNVKDIDTLKPTYARALMYYTGALADFDYDANARVINDQAAALMKRIDLDMFTENFTLEDQRKYYSALSSMNNLRLKCPRILIYNWVPYNNKWNIGGGVTIYCRNLINEIIRKNPEVTIYVLSSGFAYDATSLETFIRKIKSDHTNVHQYEIVNSPIPAEQANMFVNPSAALENKTLKDTFSLFMKKYGPFSAVHFNNIEGISLDVLDLKQDYPDTKFIFSIHNYVPMCVHGFYYMRHKHQNCSPEHTAEDCMKCTRIGIRRNIANATYERGLFNKKPEKCYSARKWIGSFGLERLDEDVDNEHILEFSKTATEKINKNCDSILAVSKRVYEIAEDNGFDKSKMSVSYIGTEVAKKQIRHSAYPVDERFKIVFLGNDINYEEKGYPFLLEALSKLEPEYAFRIDLVLTVKQKEHAEIYSMLSHFRSLKVINGYKHSDLPDIFDGCNLSLVPVLWEDNLPQIAIESVAFGIPVLASSAGGASELTESSLFRFEAGNEADFLDKIKHFVDNPEDLNEYWKHHNGLVTMKQHWQELLKFYGIPAEAHDIVVTADEFRSLIRENEFLSSSLSSILENGTYSKLYKRIKAFDVEKKKLTKRIKELEAEKEKEDMRAGAKLIFQTEHDPSKGDMGVNMFKISIDDFLFSDFYAEIKFVNISNIAASFSDVLKISGTLLENGGGGRTVHIHQLDWEKNNTPLSEQIYVYVVRNEIYFFGMHNGIASGYVYQVETLASRALHDSVKCVKLNEGFVRENTPRPAETFQQVFDGE